LPHQCVEAFRFPLDPREIRLRLRPRAVGSFRAGRKLPVVVVDDAGAEKRFEAVLRIDTPNEAQYYRHGGILAFVLRKLLAGE
jgi:aconitate hydratase